MAVVVQLLSFLGRSVTQSQLNNVPPQRVPCALRPSQDLRSSCVTLFFPSTLPRKSCLLGVSCTPFSSCGLLPPRPRCLEQEARQGRPGVGSRVSAVGLKTSLLLMATGPHRSPTQNPCRSSFSVTSGTSEFLSIT